MISCQEVNINSNLLPKFGDICRICLCEGEIKSIFGLAFEEYNLSDLLLKYFSIEVQADDNLPQNICMSCILEVIRIHEFIDKSKRTEAKLKELLDISENIKIAQPKESSRFTATRLEQQNILSKKKTCATLLDKLDIEDIELDEGPLEHYSNEEFFCEEHKNEGAPEFDGKNVEYDAGEDSSHATSDDSYACEVCSLTFGNSADLKEHKKELKHFKTRSKMHECSVCLKSFTHSHLKTHMRTHTKEQPYECDVCFRKFSFNCNLRRHMKIHTGERPYVCNSCGKGFIQLTALVDHERMHSGDTPYICNYCGKKFHQMYKLKQHLNVHMLKNGELKIEDLKDYQCEECNMVCSSKGALKTHKLKHGEKNFLCSHCGKWFYSRTLLQSHSKVHTGIKPYKCKDCGKAFTQLGSLKSHVLIHTGEKPFSCDVCLKAFTQRNHLKYHKRIHTGERPYECPYCGKTFALNGTLTIHIRTHTGVTPYICDVCNKGFYDNSNMKKHRKAHEAEVKSEIIIASG